MMNIAIQFKDVSLAYGPETEQVKVLNNISFSVNDDEIVSIVGPSGSGKTSIIMLASGLETASSGSVKINSQEIVGLKENELSEVRRKNIGIVFQSFYLIPNLTAVENVSLSLEASQQFNLEKDVENLLDEFGLSHRFHHLPSELSGGEQQRVAIARALINKPKIILADEPTGNLDSANSDSMMDLLFDYTKKSQTSLVMVTHDNSIAKRCDRIIEIRDGQIV